MFSSILIGYEFPPHNRLPLDNKIQCEVKKKRTGQERTWKNKKRTGEHCQAQ